MHCTIEICKLLILISILQDADAIIGGKVAKEGEFKYMASIRTNCDRCGASVISENHLLTAAHCIHCTQPSEITVTLGVAALNLFTPVIRGVTKIYEHENFVPEAENPGLFKKCFMWAFQCALGSVGSQMAGANDIAVLKLSESLTFEGNVAKVGLPSISDDLAFCRPCKIAGWGWINREPLFPNSILRWMEMNVLTPIDCKAMKTVHRENEFCAINAELESCLMPGDSGSPLVCDGILVGIASASAGDSREPAVFVNVSSHMDFITNAMNDESV